MTCLILTLQYNEETLEMLKRSCNMAHNWQSGNQFSALGFLYQQLHDISHARHQPVQWYSLYNLCCITSTSAGLGWGHHTGSVNKLVKSVEHTIAINRGNWQRVTQDGVCGLVWDHAEVPGVCGSAPGCCPGLLPSGVCQVILEMETSRRFYNHREGSCLKVPLLTK